MRQRRIMTNSRGSIPKEITDIFREWLDSSEAVNYLEGCAAEILKNRDFTGLPDLELIAGFTQKEGISGAGELAHALLVFILDTCLPDAASRPDDLNLLFQGQFQAYLSRAVTRFTRAMQDRARRRDADPVRYIYRRYRELLSASGEFETGSLDAGGTWYAPKKEKSASHDISSSEHSSTAAEQSPPSYSQWEFPDHLFEGCANTEKRLFKSDTLYEIAGFFHKAAMKRVFPRKLPIRELVNYTAVRFPWLNRPDMVPITTPTGKEDDTGHKGVDITLCKIPDQHVSMPHELADLAMSRKSIAVMAWEFTQTCTPVECAVFLMKLEDPPVKLREIAEQLGLKDYNTANTVYKRFTKKLTAFVTSWPGPRLDELPDEARTIFMEELKRCCQKRCE